MKKAKDIKTKSKPQGGIKHKGEEFHYRGKKKKQKVDQFPQDIGPPEMWSTMELWEPMPVNKFNEKQIDKTISRDIQTRDIPKDHQAVKKGKVLKYSSQIRLNTENLIPNLIFSMPMSKPLSKYQLYSGGINREQAEAF